MDDVVSHRNKVVIRLNYRFYKYIDIDWLKGYIVVVKRKGTE